MFGDQKKKLHGGKEIGEKMTRSEPQDRGVPARRIATYPFASFVILTFAVTWLFWMLPVLARYGLIEEAPWWWGMGSFGPSFVGVVLAWVLGGRRALTALLRAALRWRVHPGWYLSAFLLPLAVAAPALLQHLAAGSPLNWRALPGPAMVGLSFVQVLLLGGPLNEELGWRGFALPQLQRSYNALLSSLAVGIVWGLWHLPLFWAQAPGYDVLPFRWYLVNTVALSVIFTWVFNSTSGSVLLAILFHATFNTTNWLLLSLLTEHAQHGAYVYVLTLVASAMLLVWRYGPRHLSHRLRVRKTEPSLSSRAVL